MGYNLRYYLAYQDNATGLPVVVNIYYPDFDGDPLELIPADNPSTISELNSDENIFSPIRAKEYRIKFVTDNLVYPGIIDFATNNDNDWKVDILVNGATWLTGFILTDQINEEWYTDNTNHYIELTATDNLGTLKKLPLKDIDGSDFVPTTKQYLIDIVKAALNQANSQLPINIFDNLFEVDMNDRNDTVVKVFTESFSANAATKVFTYLMPAYNIAVGDTIVITGSLSNNGSFTVLEVDPTYFATVTVAETVVDETSTAGVTWTVTHPAPEIDAYQQCMVDMRTFTSNYNTFEDAYSVLTKILESRNSILFQHMGEWYIIRISELFRFDTINGSHYTIDGRIIAINNASWSADLNKDGDIIPVGQFMIKSFINPVLSNRVEYNYQNFDEAFCNQLFHRGAITLDTDTIKEYDIDCWAYLWGPILTPTTETANFGHREEIYPDTGAIIDDYAWMNNDPSHISYMKSELTQVSKDDKVTISYQHRELTDFTGSGTGALGRVVLFGIDGSHYTLDIDGSWILSDASFTTNLKFIGLSNLTNDQLKHWNTFEVTTDFIPVDGSIAIMFFKSNFSGATTAETQIKDLRVTFINYIAGKRSINVVGDYHILTVPANLKDTAEYEVYLSDSPKYLLKGALFMSDGLTLTKLWYEMSDPDIQYPIKRFNAIDHYRMSHRNMLKADGSFYKWIKGEPINSVQKITVNNGDANKRFLPAFIRDLDTAGSRFISLLIEVFDDTKDIVTTTVIVEPTEPVIYEFDIDTSTATDPDIIEITFPAGPHPVFLDDDQLVISGPGINNGSYTIVSAVLVGLTYTLTVSGGTLTSGTMTSKVFTVTRGTYIPGYTITTYSWPVNATHKFDYIFKAK
jgi:hypothetical protein